MVLLLELLLGQHFHCREIRKFLELVYCVDLALDQDFLTLSQRYVCEVGQSILIATLQPDDTDVEASTKRRVAHQFRD